MEFSAVEIFGYCASVVIAYSLTRSSIIKLRWYNLLGAAGFSAYGIIINAYPVAVLNGIIALTNIYFLAKLLINVENQFSILQVSRPSNYVDFFLEYHQQEIQSLFPRFMHVAAVEERKYFFLTDRTEVVGILSGYEESADTFIVDFDFVIPAYRDCRLGHFSIGQGQQLSKLCGYTQIVALADSQEHENYLKTLGFTLKENGRWTYEGNKEV